MKTKFRFCIRNYWKGYHNEFGIIWLGYTWQGYDLLCWELVFLGFGFCLFEESDNVSMRKLKKFRKKIINLFKKKNNEIN